MGEVIFKLNCELLYEPEEGIEVHLKYKRGFSPNVKRHLVRVGKEISLALQNSVEAGSKRPPNRAITKIDIGE